jgi:hypothetical protein
MDLSVISVLSNQYNAWTSGAFAMMPIALSAGIPLITAIALVFFAIKTFRKIAHV